MHSGGTWFYCLRGVVAHTIMCECPLSQYGFALLFMGFFIIYLCVCVHNSKCACGGDAIGFVTSLERLAAYNMSISACWSCVSVLYPLFLCHGCPLLHGFPVVFKDSNYMDGDDCVEWKVLIPPPTWLKAFKCYHSIKGWTHRKVTPMVIRYL